MKKHFLLLALSVFALAFASCKPEDEGPDKEYKLEAAPRTLTFGAEEAPSRTVTVTAENVEWELDDSATAAWATIERQDATLKVTVEDNPAEESRTTKFTITSDVTSVSAIEITVNQSAKGVEVVYSLDASPKQLGYTGKDEDRKTITVTAENVEWNVEVAEDWINYEKGEGTVTVWVDDNPVKEARRGTLTIASNVEGVAAVEIVVNQAAMEDDLAPISFEFADAEYYFNRFYPEGGHYAIAFFLYDFNELTYSGPSILLSFFSDDPDKENIRAPKITEGRYEVLEDPRYPEKSKFIASTANDFGVWEDSFYIEYFNNSSDLDTQQGIVGGYFDVTLDGDNYNIEFNMELSGGKMLEADYNGPIDIQNLSMLSSLTHDVDINLQGGGMEVNYWEQYGGNADRADYWDITLWGEGIEWAIYHTLTGEGDMIQLRIFSENINPTGPEDHIIPSGRYMINNSRKRGTVDLGNTITNYGEDLFYEGLFGGSWYIEFMDREDRDGDGKLEEGEYGSFSNAHYPGYVDIEYNAETGMYHVVVDAMDDAYNKIDVIFDGPWHLNFPRDFDNAPAFGPVVFDSNKNNNTKPWQWIGPSYAKLR